MYRKPHVNQLAFEDFVPPFGGKLRSATRVYSRWERGDNVPHLDTLLNIAELLQVTLDELVGRTPPPRELKIRNHKLQHLCQQADTLPDEDQQALIQVLDGLVKKTQLGNMMGQPVQRARRGEFPRRNRRQGTGGTWLGGLVQSKKMGVDALIAQTSQRAASCGAAKEKTWKEHIYIMKHAT